MKTDNKKTNDYSDDYMLQRVNDDERAEGGRAEYYEEAEAGSEIISHLTDGDVTNQDLAEYKEFMGDLSNRLTELGNNISALQRSNNPAAQARAEDLRRKYLRLKQLKSVVQEVGKDHAKADKEQTPEEKEKAKKRGDIAAKIVDGMKEGKNPAKAMRLLNLAPNGKKLEMAEDTMFLAMMLSQGKNKTPEKEQPPKDKPRNLAELTGRGTTIKPRKTQAFDAQKAQALLQQRSQSQR